MNNHSNRKALLNLFDRLVEAYGPQHRWPARSPTEVVIGAILAQNTAWTNVERAIANLRSAECLDFGPLREVPQDRLAELIRPSGTFRIKAARLKAFVDVLWSRHEGRLEAMLDGGVEKARSRLLAVRGIGPETADAILLYASGMPSFVIDEYTMRVLRRHFLIDERADYEAVRSLFHRSLPPDTKLFNEFHALFVAVGKKHCRAAPVAKDARWLK